jgi:chromate transporter
MPFPAVVVGALVFGFVAGKIRPEIFLARPKGQREGRVEEIAVDAGQAGKARRPILIAGAGLALWFAPVLVVGAMQGWSGLFAQLGWFFSKAAVVTFGGAYAVLPYVGQEAVEHYHWLTAPQMLDGLAFAETTPGPLIMVLQFVGFLAGWQHAGAGSLGSATLGAAMTTWVTFVPTYLFILLGAPYVERWRNDPRLTSALAAVTAAVVGVILNLAVWFGWHALITAGPVGGPWWGRVDSFAVGLTVAAFVALQRFKNALVPVVLASGLAGLAWGGIG